MTDEHHSDPLEALLAPPHIDNDGFTERTLAALPRARRFRRGELLSLLLTCAGLFIGLVVFPGAELISLTIEGLLQADPLVPELTILSVIVLLTSAWTGWHWLAQE